MSHYDEEELYPLLPSQLGVLLESIKDSQLTRYNLPCITRLDKDINIERLIEVIHILSTAHKEWHTKFVLTNDGIRQYSDKEMEIVVKRHVMSDGEAENYAYGNFIRPFDVMGGQPLVRWEIIEGEKHNYVLHDFHHSIADGITYSPVLTREFSDIFNRRQTENNQASLGGNPSQAPILQHPSPNTPSYGMYEYANDCSKLIGTKAYHDAKKFYHDNFCDTEFITLSQTASKQAGNLLRCSEFIPHDTVEQWCTEHATSSNLLFMAAFTLVVGRLARNEKFGYVALNHGRLDKRLANAYGMFVTSAVMSADITSTQTVLDFIKAGRKQMMSVIRHRSCPFNEVFNDLSLEQYISFNFLAMEKVQEHVILDGRTFPVEQISRRQVSTDLNCDIYYTNNDFEIRCEGPDTRFTPAYLHMVGKAIATVIEHMMQQPDATLADISLLSDTQCQQLITLGTGETLHYDTQETWLSLFARQVEKTPDAIAVADHCSQMTYRELDEASSAYAETIAPNTFVCIEMPRVKEFIVAVVGIWKAHSAYVPINTEFPEERKQFIREECDGHPLPITHHPSPNTQHPSPNTQHPSPDTPAYMIYTSGSTGKPKGVMVPHSALTNFIMFQRHCWPIHQQSRIASHTNFAFDASLKDLYAVLTVGGTLHILSDEIRMDINAMRRYFHENGITGTNLVTPVGALFTEGQHLSLDYISFGGERLTFIPDNAGKTYNTYGPTETTIDVTYLDISHVTDAHNIPIGKPIHNNLCLILDLDCQLMPMGAVGELCVAGPQLAVGYWNNTELTDDRFRTINIQGKATRIYRTGDLCRWNEDGLLEYIGRIDNQVKLRGYRIELGDIEAVALQMDAITQVSAIIHDEVIVLYYVSSCHDDAFEHALAEHLQSQLPAYMQPSALVHIDAMPLTPNGKINRKALPKPSLAPADDAPCVAPATATEQQVHDIACHILDTDTISVTANLLDLGMSSLALMKFASSLLDEAGIRVGVSDIINNPTIRAMAQTITTQPPSPNTQHPTPNTQHPSPNTLPLTPIQDYYLRSCYADGFTISNAIRIDGISADKLRQCIRTAMMAHPVIFTTFHKDGEEWCQMPHPDAEPEISIETITVAPDRQFFEQRLQPFHLNGQHLYRCRLFTATHPSPITQHPTPNTHHPTTYLLFELHHTLGDTGAMSALLNDILRAVKGEQPKGSTTTFYDYALSLRRRIASPYGIQTLNDVTSQLRNDTLALYPKSQTHLSTDAAQNFFVVNVSQTDLLSFCRRNEGTPFTLFFHALGNVMQRVLQHPSPNTHHLCFPVVSHGRYTADTINQMGCYASLMLITNVRDEAQTATLSSRLKAIHKSIIQAAAHDFVTVHALRAANIDASRLMLVNDHTTDSITQHPTPNTHFGIQFIRIAPQKPFAPLQLALEGSNHHGYRISAAYDPSLYSAEDVMTFLDTLNNEISSIVTNEIQRTTSPLLQSQMGLFIPCLRNPQSTQYTLPVVTQLNDNINLDTLADAILAIYDNDPVFRTRFMITATGEPRQWSDPDMKLEIKRETMSYAELTDYIQNTFVRPFDILSGKPLLRTEIIQTERGAYLLSDFSHLIIDGMSYSPNFTMSLVDKAYHGIVEPVSYGLYDAAKAEVDTFKTEQYQKDKDYYAQKFAGVAFATLSSGVNGTLGKMIRKSSFISRNTCDEWCREQGVSVNFLFQAAFTHVLSALLHTTQHPSPNTHHPTPNTHHPSPDTLAYTSLNHGRLDKRLRTAMGMFVKSVPVLVDLRHDMTSIELMKQLRVEMMSTIRHGTYPFTHLCNDLTLTPGISFNFQAMAEMEEVLCIGSQRLKAWQPDRADIDNDLSILIFYTGDNYEIRAETSDALNDAHTAQMFADAIVATIHNMMANPQAPLSDIAITDRQQQQQLVNLGKGETLEYDASETWLSLFARQVEKTPDAIAVADHCSQMTYRELDEASDTLAAHLVRNHNVTPGSFVAIKMPRVKEYVLAITAIHKAHAAYVPIDSEYPEERINYMLNDTHAATVIEDIRYDSHLMVNGIPATVLDAATQHPSPNTHHPSPDTPTATAPDAATQHPTPNTQHPSPDTPAYIIYTSGTTGKPKGVVVTQRGLTNFTLSTITINHLVPTDRISCHRSFSFDAHIEDIFPVLAAGASIHIMSDDIRKDLQAIHTFLVEHSITGGGYTTSIARMLLQTYNLSQRYITCGGEALTNVHSDDVQIINVYGPTECTDHVTTYALEKGRTYNSVPIGRPLPNMQCLILDHHQQLVPYGAAGELCVAGPQLAAGYWDGTPITQHPTPNTHFQTVNIQDHPTRVYRTGDLCRWNKDGQLEYIRRIDHQVKVRGYRIELGDIETVALQHDTVRQAAAIVKDNNILLYYVPDSSDDDTSRLDHYLKATLPSYMAPTALIPLDAMPLTPNGKIDRKALPSPTRHPSSITLPANPTEAKILNITKQFLPDVEFGVTDDLMYLGMTSLSAMRLAVRLQAEGIDINVTDMLRYHTIRDIVQSKTKASWWYTPYDDTKPILVCECGILGDSAIQHHFELWKTTFNVLIIEPVMVHYEEYFADTDLLGVVKAHLQYLQDNIPHGRNPDVIIGFSVGGTLAYYLACEWNKKTHHSPAVCLGDSFMPHKAINVKPLTTDSAWIVERRMEDHIGELSQTDRQTLHGMLLYSFGVAAKLLNSAPPFPSYDGKVALIRALKGDMKTKLLNKANEARIRMKVKHLTVTKIKDRDHFGLCLDGDLAIIVSDIVNGLVDNA